MVVVPGLFSQQVDLAHSAANNPGILEPAALEFNAPLGIPIPMPFAIYLAAISSATVVPVANTQSTITGKKPPVPKPLKVIP